MRITPDLDALSFDAVIPSALLLNDKLEPNAIKLYAFVRGLTKAHGYCFATNEYLAICMRCDVSTIKRLLKSLQQEQFIEIKTDKSRIHWQRRIFVGVNLKNCLRRLKNEPPPAQNRAPPSSKMSPIYKECIQSEILKEGEEGAAPPSPPPPLFSEGKVKMPLEKKEALEKEFGKERVAEVIEDLKNYAEVNPKKFAAYGCHAGVVRTWLRREQKEGKSSSGSSFERNRELARKIAIRFPNERIEVGQDSISFIAGMYPFTVHFKDSGFRDQVIGRLKLMNLITDGLM